MYTTEHIADSNDAHKETANNDMQTQESSVDQKLTSCLQEMQEWKERCFRATADFDNFKRREEKIRLQTSRYAQTELITGLLPIFDNFERALHQKKMEELPQELQSWFKGIMLIDKELQKYLINSGVQEIKETTTFDPELHEAVMTVEAPNVSSGNIVEVLQKGYRFKGAVIRPAKVSIAQ